MPQSKSRSRAVGPLIALLTDFGLDDWYAAVLKAVLLSHCPAARLVDVTHAIPQGDVLAGSIALERAIAAFPPATAHLAVVDPGVGSQRRILVVRIERQWIVCPDNGLITWAFRRHPAMDVYELTWRPAVSSRTFHGRDIMAPAVGMLCGGVPVRKMARRISDPVLLHVAPVQPPARSGRIIHLDHFGNASSDIPEETIRRIPAATVRVGRRNLGPLRLTYSEVKPGDALALIGSSGLLEIAVRNGSARDRLGLKVGMKIILESGSLKT